MNPYSSAHGGGGHYPASSSGGDPDRHNDYRQTPPPLQHPHPTHPPVSLPESSVSPPIGYGQPPLPSQQQQQPGYGQPSQLPYGQPPHQHQQQHQQQHGQYGVPSNGFPYNASQSGGFTDQFGNMMSVNDLGMAGQLGMQFGRSAVLAGNDYVQKNFDRFIPVSSLKYYFAVSNTYVIHKLAILLFPFRHKPWSRMARRSEENGQMEGYKLPREDINAPDMYIPVMAFVTYVLLVGIVVGREDKFDPSILGLTATTAIGLVALEVGLLKLGCYLLNITTDIQFLDLVAYCGYKFVGVIFTVLIQFIFPGRGMWIAFAYTCMAIGFFLLRSLRYIVLPDSSNTPSTVLNPQRKRRVHFLFAMATLQLVSMWFLSITVNPIETVPTKPIGGTAPTST